MNGVPTPLVRAAVVYPGDVTDPGTRSGSPYGVLTGLCATGADVFPVDARPSHLAERATSLALAPLHQRGIGATDPWVRLRRGYGAALQGSQVARMRSATASRRLARIPDLDVVIQIGAGFLCRGPAPVVVHDDMTIVQALRYPYAAWTALRRRDVEARIALQREVYRSAAAVCVESGWAASSVIDDYGVPAERVHVVGTASAIDVRQPQRSWDVPRFLFVGLDFERKNGPRVLRAFARIRSEHPGAVLDVVGRHPPLDLPGVLGHGVLRKTSTEERAELRRLFDEATCFVMPSLFEPGGVVFTEAAAAGLPSIGGSVGGSADLIGDGGAVIEPEDDDALLAAMSRFCDPEEARRVGAVAGRRAPDFTWPALAARLIAPVGL